jgi:23S rRNA pseudouridine1911/1915/1917 synthase
VPDSRLTLSVAPDQAGIRLDRLLASRLGSRAAAQTAIEAGEVLVNGRHRAKRHLVQAGDVIEVADTSLGQAGGPPPEGPPAEFKVAYEDDHLLVVDKPPGVVVHPARGHATGTLSQALAGQTAGGEPARAGIVHRLDRDTSGLLVVARSDDVHRALKSLLSSRRLTREYAALVEGRPPSRTGTIDAPIGRDRRDRLRMSLDTDTPRAARTHFEIQRRLPTSTLLRVALETGRTHQIRVHLAAIGHPVAGDPLYGQGGQFGLERQFLHAERLAFQHPVTGQPIDIRSPLPEDLRQALERAERRQT